MKYSYSVWVSLSGKRSESHSLDESDSRSLIFYVPNFLAVFLMLSGLVVPLVFLQFDFLLF